MIVIATSVSVASVLIVVLPLVFCCRFCQHKKTISDPKQHTTPTSSDVDIDINKLPSNELYHQRLPSTTSDIDSRLGSFEYRRNNIVHVSDIGRGAFGSIFRAKAYGIVAGREWSDVAVKVLDEQSTDEARRDFLRVAVTMSELRQTNILSLLGVCLTSLPTCLVVEYMNLGDLREYLRGCSPEHFILRRQSLKPKLSPPELVDISQQVAAGMQHLSSLGFVHRDLASRNCLASTRPLIIKISDFGLVQRLDAEFYQGDDNDAIAVRWMPLESIFYNRFTTKSDVWSFGVTMWEIFSFAMQPYGHMTPSEVVKYVSRGNVLCCPDGAPERVYDMMLACWSSNPDLRPTFSHLYTSLSILHKTLNAKLKVFF